MRKIMKNRFKNMFLVGMILVSMLFVTTAGAETVDNISDIGIKEEIAASKVPTTSDLAKATEEAEKIREKLEEEMEKEIAASIENAINDESISVSRSSEYVILGTDKTFYSADDGDCGKLSWGIIPTDHGCAYSLSTKSSFAGSTVAPIGIGGASAWSWVGQSFYIPGSGSRSANIKMNGEYEGMTFAAAGGASESEITLVVKDTTTGTVYDTVVYSKSTGGAGYYPVDTSFNKGININLQGGHEYLVYLVVETSVSTYGYGGAESDFGPYDGDGGVVKYSSIEIDF
ncbi:hypothetical protein V7O62_08235 [Methanolobus sp. ZRKC2]|uniref:hypothetical protein n=1 Tax=Methanolobus sp. ZRKC2 TaxID=3125783 RepID=UPI00324C7409